MVVHYIEDMYKYEDAVMRAKLEDIVRNESSMQGEECFSDPEKEVTNGNGEKNDCETFKDSLSSQGESPTVNDDKGGKISRASKKPLKKQPLESSPKATSSDHQEAKKLHMKASKSSQKKSQKLSRGSSDASPKGHDKKVNIPRVLSKNSLELSNNNKFNDMKINPNPSSESSEGVDDRDTKELKEADVLDEIPNDSLRIGTYDETAETQRNDSNKDMVNREIEKMELKIGKLEVELREMAALELSLYSITSEHGSSGYKVHTPARRLSRLYFHACKYWTQNKRASIARSIISGLVLIAKSCGNDVPRLTFWWSNAFVLRDTISRAFGNSHHSSLVGKILEANGEGKRGKTLQKQNGSAGKKLIKKLVLGKFLDDWQETSTFTDALEKIESWIFSRVIESIWWQTLTPHMQSPLEELYRVKNSGRLMGPALGDQQQGRFSVNIWTSAFMDAYRRLCPVRAGGSECGCLPVLSRMVMEQCVTRLDVAMFNAILRESADEIPTDPISDPIVDSRVLPIPAGDLSFGSGAQLQNFIGNMSRWLTETSGTYAGDSPKDQIDGVESYKKNLGSKSKSFVLLNALSALLMLPKDLLMDKSIRMEVCLPLGLPLIIRILCNFTPDEFCPDPVPVSLLEALNSENILMLEQRQTDVDCIISSFPVNAASVVYNPPSLEADAAAESVVQKGYTSDEELDALESPLTSIIDEITPTSTVANGRNHETARQRDVLVLRYELLREVWSM